MKFHFVEHDDDDDYAVTAQEDVYEYTVTNAHYYGTRVLRAPSFDEDESDEEIQTTLALRPGEILRGKSRDDVLRLVDQTCERKAAQAVTDSAAYQTLCDALRRTRLDAEAKLRQQLQQRDQEQDVAFLSIIRKNQEAETIATRKLEQLRQQEQQAMDQMERQVQQLKKEREAAERAAEATRKAAEEATRQEEEAREKKLQDERDREEAIKAQEEQERAKEVQKKQAVAREKEELARKKREVEAKKQQALVATQEAPQEAKKHVEEAQQRIQRLEAIESLCKDIDANPDPNAKKTRVDIKLQAGCCNQVAAAPSKIKMVVTKIQTLLQTAKAAGDTYFKYALEQVGTNLMKRARVAPDYKACYPLAHVITMACVQTPELTDVLLAMFNKACVFTIPANLVKTSDQSVADYKKAMGFEKAVGDTSDPDGLEHVTEYTKRMAMIVAVLAAVMQTKPWDGSPQPPGMTIGDCWIWMARLVNEPPHLMTGSLILTILEVAGFELLQQYRKQFHKLLVLIADAVCPRLSKDAKTGAANAAGQLDTLISEYQRNGCQLKEPDGRQLKETKLTEADEEKTEGEGGGGGRYGGGGYGGGGRYGGGGGRGRGRGRGW